LGLVEQQGAGEDDRRHADRQKRKLVDAVEDQELGHARKQRGDRHRDDSFRREGTRFGVLGAEAMVSPTRARPSDANGQPPRQNRMAEISTARNARRPFRAAARRER